MKLSYYAILHFLMNIEMRFLIFTSSLDFNDCLNLNMLDFVNNTLECIVDIKSQYLV